ncbi:MAG: ATPase [Lachnospiraceae bacterium]|nr:ATPase [Lachnospiraceae bacterium]
MIYWSSKQAEKQMEAALKELKMLDKAEKGLPKGELFCAKNRKYYKWYVRDKNGLTYLPKKNEEVAKKLALKKYNNVRRKELEGFMRACKSYLHYIKRWEGKTEKLLCHTEFGRLLQGEFLPTKEALRIWQEQEYENCQKHPENLIIKGTGGKYLRSKSEAMIDAVLTKYHVPFHYEEKLVLGNLVVYPDFVIRHPVSGEYYYWEHFGLMDDEEYVENACQKIKSYCKNGIIPSDRLIMTFESKQNPFSMEMAEKVIKDYFLEN